MTEHGSIDSRTGTLDFARPFNGHALDRLAYLDDLRGLGVWHDGRVRVIEEARYDEGVEGETERKLVLTFADDNTEREYSLDETWVPVDPELTEAQTERLAEIKQATGAMSLTVRRDVVDEGFVNVQLEGERAEVNAVLCCSLSVSPRGTVAHYDTNVPPHYATARQLLDAMGVPPTITEGQRYRLTQPVERYPHFSVGVGALGTVTEATHDLVLLRMDERIEGAEEWDNEIQWTPDDDCDPAALPEWKAAENPDARRAFLMSAEVVA